MMFVTKKALPRRTFLRGMGTTLALPLLDAMVPALSARAAQAHAAPRLRLHRQRRHPEPVDAGDDRRRLRADADPAAAREPCATRSTSSAACRTCRPTPSATAPAIIRARRRCG